MRGSSLLAVALAGALTLAGSSVALAAPGLPNNCAPSGLTVTCRYTSINAEQTFTVPAGVTSVHVTAIGGAGARGSDQTSRSASGGRGGSASGALTGLVAGSRLFVEVGGNALGRGGGFNGGASGGGFSTTMFPPGAGGGGGGASDVRTQPRVNANTLDSRLIVAGGGGGGSALAFTNSDGAVAGEGGGAGEPGLSGYDPEGSAEGGDPGSSDTGGKGSPSAYPRVNPADAGKQGSGGVGASAGLFAALGGGGGGGLFGGGGGGINRAAGGGGGGGSSKVPPGGTSGLSAEQPSATITYTVAAVTITKTSGDGQSGAKGRAFPEPLVVTVTDPVDNRPITGARVAFNVVGGSASFAGNRSATVTTTANGRATSPPLTAGNRLGTVTVNANLEGGAGQDLPFVLEVQPSGPINPPPTSGGAAVRGGGTLAVGGQRYSLAIDARTTADGVSSGRFAVSGGGADTTAASRTITTVTTTPSGATITGVAVTAAGKPTGFTITVVDRPGGRDQVTARIGGRTLTGTLTTGDITTT